MGQVKEMISPFACNYKRICNWLSTFAGTWAWGNKFLFSYDESMDPELQRVFDFAVAQGVNLFDTADSYGTGALNGRSEQLLGRFIRENAAFSGSASDAMSGRRPRSNGTIHVATKLAGYPWRVTAGNYVAACRCVVKHGPWLCVWHTRIHHVLLCSTNASTMYRGPSDICLLSNGPHKVHNLTNYAPTQSQWRGCTICRGSLRRLEAEQLAIGQLHWSAAKYAPLQERAQVRQCCVGANIFACFLNCFWAHSGYYHVHGLCEDGPSSVLACALSLKRASLFPLCKCQSKCDAE